MLFRAEVCTRTDGRKAYKATRLTAGSYSENGRKAYKATRLTAGSYSENERTQQRNKADDWFIF